MNGIVIGYTFVLILVITGILFVSLSKPACSFENLKCEEYRVSRTEITLRLTSQFQKPFGIEGVYPSMNGQPLACWTRLQDAFHTERETFEIVLFNCSLPPNSKVVDLKFDLRVYETTPLFSKIWKGSLKAPIEE
jgi:hypothetical protein